MYNEIIKQKYIETLEGKSRKQCAQNVFKAAETFENAVDADLYTFDRETRFDLYKAMQIKSYQHLYSSHNETNCYSKWCYEQGLTETSNYFTIHYSKLQECLAEKNTLISYEELKRNEDLLINDCDKFLLEALYLGIRGKAHCEIKNLRAKDIQKTEDGHYVAHLCTGRDVKITNRCAMFALNAAETFEYERTDGKRHKLSDGPYIDIVFKRNPSYENTDILAAMVNKLKSLRKKHGLNENIRVPILYDSGLVNACKAEMEKNGIRDLKQFFKSPEGKEVLDQYDIRETTYWNTLQKYKPYFEDI